MKEVKDLLDADQNFMSFTFKAKYKIRTNCLEYNKVLSVLKLFGKRCSSNLSSHNSRDLIASLLSSPNVSQMVYKYFIEKKKKKSCNPDEKSRKMAF